MTKHRSARRRRPYNKQYEELEESQRHAAFLADLIEQSSQALGVGYPDGRLGTVNEAFCRLTGYSKSELATMDWAKVLTPPEWREIEFSKLEELHRTNQPVRYEKEYVRRDGTRVPIELLVHLVRNESGTPQYYYAFINDITGRKRSEGALRASEERFSKAFQNSPDAITITRLTDGKLIDVNERFIQLSGYSREEVLGRTAIELDLWLNTADRELYVAALKEKGRVTNFETAYRARTGEIRSFLVSGECIEIDGEPSILGIIHDITDRKRAEQELLERTQLNQVLLDAFPCVALLLRPQTREIVASNTAAVRVGAVPGTHCFSTWGQRENPCPWCLAPEVWATGEARQLEIEALGTVWDAHWIPVGPDLYMHYAFDATEQKKAEQAIQDSEERFRILADGAFEAVVISRDGLILDTNKVFCEKSGFTLDELVGLSIRDIVAPEFEKRSYGACPFRE